MKKKLDKRKKVIKAQKAAQPKNKDPSAIAADDNASVVSSVAAKLTKPAETSVAVQPRDVDTSKSVEDKGKALDADADDEESVEVKRAKRKAEKKAKREERRAREKELVELKTTQALSAIASKALPEPLKCKSHRCTGTFIRRG